MTSYVWDLPRLNGSSGFVRRVLGGWQHSGIWTFQSGRPFSIFSGRDNSLSGINRDYADLTGQSVELDTGRPRNELLAEYFNTAAFATNALGTFGNAPRNLLRGPELFSLDMAVMKIIAVRESVRFQLRGEFFNAFNRPNFGNPRTNQRQSSRFGRIEGAGDPRIIQIALKVLF